MIKTPKKGKQKPTTKKLLQFRNTSKLMMELQYPRLNQPNLLISSLLPNYPLKLLVISGLSLNRKLGWSLNLKILNNKTYQRFPWITNKLILDTNSKFLFLESATTAQRLMNNQEFHRTESLKLKSKSPRCNKNPHKIKQNLLSIKSKRVLHQGLRSNTHNQIISS